MKKYITALPVIAALLLPVAASAHGHASYLINGVQYDIVIGSLNEPVAVDDKTGVDLRISNGGRLDAENKSVGAKPTAGLEKDLKVELIAGDKKRTLDLSPVYNTPGAYKAPFFPTVATTLSYRIFGTINQTPFDVTYTCRAEGATTEDEGEKEISQGIKQLVKGGGFGCPTPKTELGFPEPSASVKDLEAMASSADTNGMWGIGIGAIGLVLAGFALRRRG